MGTTKKHFYQEDKLYFSDLCKALGHPARLSIVELLSKNDHLNCQQLRKKIDLSQSSISQHCQILYKHGLVGFEVIGSNCYYRLDNEVLTKITNYVDVINQEVPSITGKVYYPQRHA